MYRLNQEPYFINSLIDKKKQFLIKREKLDLLVHTDDYSVKD